MTTGARALGRLFDITAIAAPADAVSSAITGNRVSLKHAGGVTFVVITSAGSTDELDLDLREHTAATSGLSQDLDIITTYYIKSEATLDGDEDWTAVTQAAASEISDAGGASEQTLLVVEVSADQLSDGYTHVSLDVPDLGSNGSRYVAILAITHDLYAQRSPELLINPQA
jgi:hypothetical protein